MYTISIPVAKNNRIVMFTTKANDIETAVKEAQDIGYVIVGRALIIR